MVYLFFFVDPGFLKFFVLRRKNLLVFVFSSKCCFNLFCLSVIQVILVQLVNVCHCFCQLVCLLIKTVKYGVFGISFLGMLGQVLGFRKVGLLFLGLSQSNLVVTLANFNKKSQHHFVYTPTVDCWKNGVPKFVNWFKNSLG